MNPGQLDQRVTYEEEQEVDVGGGVTEMQYVAVATVWGSVKPLEGNEYWQAQQTQSQTSHRVKIRRPLTDTSGNEVRPSSDGRIVWRRASGNRTLNITAEREIEDGRYHEIMCTEPT